MNKNNKKKKNLINLKLIKSITLETKNCFLTLKNSGYQKIKKFSLNFKKMNKLEKVYPLVPELLNIKKV
jgi:hypothetical protein